MSEAESTGADPVNLVQLRVGARDFGGWKEIRITAGIERQARDFSLSVTRRWPGTSEAEQLARPVKVGDLCEVFVGEDLVITGFIDATPVRYSARDITLGVAGRSKTGDLVDCSAINTPGQWSERKLEKIAADIAGEYGIRVLTETDTGAALSHQIQVGETAFESIDRMLRLRQLLATDNEQGDLVFIDAGSLAAGTKLELGANVLECDAPLDFKDRFSEIRCKGQRSIEDDEPVEEATEEDAETADAAITRKRVLVLKQSGQADEGTCQDRVRYESAHRKAKSLSATYRVQGWRQTSGELWRPNMMVRVIDPIAGFDADLLIAEVEYSLGQAGMTCGLRVGPLDGFTSKARKKAKGGGGSNWADVLPAK